MRRRNIQKEFPDIILPAEEPKAYEDVESLPEMIIPDDEKDGLEEQPEVEEEQPEVEEETRVEDLEVAIQSAETISEVCEALSKVEQIEGSRLYSTERVIDAIQDADKYLDDNLDQIIIYTITRQSDQVQEIFAQKVNLITEGRQVGLRSKVKELMKAKMNDRFQERSKEFGKEAVESVTSLETFYRVLNQFKQIREGDKLYKKEQVIESIKKANRDLTRAVDIGTLSIDKPKEIDQEIRMFLEHENIPNDSGIFNKAYELLRQKLIDKNIEKFSSDSKTKRQGILRRIFGRWFKG